MKCPKCKSKRVVLGKGDGFSQDIRECEDCGHLWTFKGEERIVLKESANKKK
jgi:DNA-directed RNA polymerase subunit M/transcription elongation factor TFIIS